MYKVLKYFTDLQDNRYAYHEGDIFPREGLDVSPERLVELSSNKNKRGIPLIELVDFMNPPTESPVEEKPKPKRTSKRKEK